MRYHLGSFAVAKQKRRESEAATCCANQGTRAMSYARQCTAAVTHALRDTESTVHSVARVGGGGWLVKVGQSSEGLVNRLRATFPLATVCMSEDLVGGCSTAHVLFPEEDEQHSQAMLLARATRLSRVFGGLSQFLFSMAVLVFFASVFPHL